MLWVWEWGELEEDEEDDDEEDASCDNEESDIDFGISVRVNNLDNGHSLLKSREWYAIVSPTYQYWYIGYAKCIKCDFVNMSFLEQVQEGSNRFRDENYREDVPIAQLFQKLSTAPQSVSKYRANTQKEHEKDSMFVTENYMKYL